MGRTGLLLMCLLALAGCQTGLQSVEKSLATEEAFARSWSLYQDCRSADLETILVRTPQWERMAAPPASVPVRLSVDPRALAADCAIHAGDLALMQGEQGLAVEFFSLVIERYPQPDYAYYVARAWDGLLRTAPGVITASVRPASFTR